MIINIDNQDENNQNELFENWFEIITGFPSFRWQRRLFASFLDGDIPAMLDLPTGLGKTSVMVIWLLARAFNPSLPRRLVYVVDRRVVVDQATKAAEILRIALEEKVELAGLRIRLGLTNTQLPVSTLRGKFVDNREWLADPAVPAIIVGTIDMIGSRLLFEGYGVSRSMRRYHAGFLGADTLCVLDEAHLCPSFEALVNDITNNSIFMPHGEELRQLIPCFYYLPLSATGRKENEKAFRLVQEDYQDSEVAKRLSANKNLVIDALDEGGTLSSRLADHAWENRGTNNRVLVYCDRREDAKKVATELDVRMKREKLTCPINLLVGARRVLERQKLAGWLEQNGFLAGSFQKRKTPVFLIATSAGEVGIDLDADHMICDLVAFERMVQRLGRVNRRGERNSKIVVVTLEPKKSKLDRPPKPLEQKSIEPEAPVAPERTADKSIKEAYKAKKKDFESELKAYNEGKKSYSQKLETYCKKREEYNLAWSLYRIFKARKLILDSLNGNANPGAIVKLKERAATSKRLEILLRHATSSEPLRPDLTRALVDAWSMTSLEAHTGRPEIEPWLRGWIDKDAPETTVAWRHFLPWREREIQPNPTDANAFFEAAPIHLSETLDAPTSEITEVLIKRATALLKNKDYETVLGRKSPAALVFNRSGKLQQAFTVGSLAEIDKSKLKQLLQGKQIVISRALGGLNGDGLLDGSADSKLNTLDNGWLDTDLQETIGYRIRLNDSTDSNAGGWRVIHTYQLSDSEDEENPLNLVVQAFRGTTASRQGDPAVSRYEQSLTDHHEWAGKEAETIARALGLSNEYSNMLIAAVRGHDLGKNRELWQNAMNAPTTGRPYAKTKGGGNFRLLSGYRHEFGSLGDIQYDEAINQLAEELKELALHCIASHHGYACPVIPPIDPSAPPSVLAARAQEAALRFANLQRRWGPWGLAWWEAVFRAADHRASRKLDEQLKTEGK
ncbi:MAG: type I-U CRISPR-associated helicase/endonuclease Cas3 [Methylobacter sp.]|nr:type I-U CRISPR-associated helicase/endonuclease Cas3 [Methylobacter sp.]